MKITTCYTVNIKGQPGLNEKKEPIVCRVNESLMKETSKVCLDALKSCISIFLQEWDYLSTFPSTPKEGVLSKKRVGDILIHSTKGSPAKYPQFDKDYPNMPAYFRRSVIARAIGIISSYKSNHKNWEETPVSERGTEPVLRYSSYYELTFYKQERDFSRFSEGVIQLKLYDGKTWDWHAFCIKKSDAEYIRKMAETRELLSPVIEKIRGKYQIRFSFKESRELVSDENPLGYLIMAVDLGINAAATWCVMNSAGTIFGKGVIYLPNEEDQLNHAINKKRQYQQAGKKSHCVYRWVKNANERLSVNTAKAIMDVAVYYNVDCIVFEHLNREGKKSRGRYRERIHMWRANDVQKRVELQAHRFGMRISRVCAWGTSKYAYDGSGQTDRKSVYHFEHGKKVYNYSICTFPNGKVYNCDLSAAQNIGARYFLREYAKLNNCPEMPKTPQRTLKTLWDVADQVSKNKNALAA